MRNLIIILISVTMLLSSCKKDKIVLSPSEYMIFGHYYGKCGGEQCIEIFRLEEKQLLEDTTDRYPANDFYAGKFIQLSQDKFNAAKELTDYFPKDLLNETTSAIGKPDAADGGGLYIEYNYEGVRKFWRIDQMKHNVPAKYHAFMDKVNEKIKLIQ